MATESTRAEPDAVPASTPDAPPPAGPGRAAPPVSEREGAERVPGAVRVIADAAVKHNTFPSRPGYPSGMAHWETHLHVEAWVPSAPRATNVWLDLHVFGHDGALVHSETLRLDHTRPAGDGGEVFELDRVVYEGATATPGSVTPRPDVRRVQYRLYCERDGGPVTDGRLYECALKPDVSSA